jgi:hypothetical protein
LCVSSILPVAVPVPYFQLTLVPLRMTEVIDEVENKKHTVAVAVRLRWPSSNYSTMRSFFSYI